MVGFSSCYVLVKGGSGRDNSRCCIIERELGENVESIFLTMGDTGNSDYDDVPYCARHSERSAGQNVGQRDFVLAE